MVDAHFHAWQLARGDYGWLTPALKPIYRDVSIDDWQAIASPFGLTGGIVVQAAPTERETLFLLQQAERHPAVLGVVGWVDMHAPDAPDRIRTLARHPKLKGLRPMLQDLADPAWILQAALAPALHAMADCGLVFDALVKPVHLPHILTLAQAHPGLQIVIDHGAKPDISGGEWQPWADRLTAIATQTSAVCKLSGLLTEAAPGCKASAVRPWAEHVLETFGPERVLWGSDWPVLELNGGYGQWVALTRQVIAPLAATQQQAIMGGNARRIYRL